MSVLADGSRLLEIRVRRHGGVDTYAFRYQTPQGVRAKHATLKSGVDKAARKEFLTGYLGDFDKQPNKVDMTS